MADFADDGRIAAADRTDRTSSQRVSRPIVPSFPCRRGRIAADAPSVMSKKDDSTVSKQTENLHRLLNNPQIEQGYKLYTTLPLEVVEALIGLGLCFFGGTYVASIAAAEAFMLCGWDTTQRALDDVYGELKSIKDASVADSKKDDDHDGKPDIEQLPPAEQLKRRVRVAALAVRDPTKLSTAAGGLYMGWIAVQGTLRLKFARTVTLGVSIANTLDGIVQRNGVPVLQKYVDPALAHWLPVIVSTMAKMLAVALAWQLQVMISSVQSALRGGLLASRKTLAYLNRTGRVKLAEDDTYLDEMAGFALAASGCYFQWRTGWAPPFPMNIVMLPFTAVEWYIRWSVTA